jgi:orotate phosphoribosyltransferase
MLRRGCPDGQVLLVEDFVTAGDTAIAALLPQVRQQ